MLHKKLIPISVGLFLALGLAACGGNDEVQEQNTQVGEEVAGSEDSNMDLEPNEPVAIVNGEEISQQELNDKFEQVKMFYQQQGMELEGENEVQIQKEVLDQLVNTKLISQAAAEEGFSTSQDEVQAQIEQIKEQYGNDEELNAVLEQNNLNLASLEKEIKNELTINKYLESNIEAPSVSQDEIKEKYEQYKQQTENMPELEEVKSQLEEEIKSEKGQASISELVNKLKETSEIEILV